MMRVQHEFARHNDQYTALDVVGFPYSEYHERGRSPEETGLIAYEYFVSDEYSDYGAFEDRVLFKVDRARSLVEHPRTVSGGCG